MSASWYRINNATDGEVEALIYDTVGGWGISAQSFVSDLKAKGAKKIHVRINSPGGDVFDGLAIYNFLRSQDTTITIDGLAASVASIVAMSGKTVRMAENAFLMIHNPWGVVVGTSEEMRSLADALDKIQAQLVGTYQRRTNKEATQITEWMNAETWFNFEEARANGFVDEASDPLPKAANFSAFNLSRFQRVPVALLSTDKQSPVALTETGQPKDKHMSTDTKAPATAAPPAPAAPGAEPAKVDPRAEFNKELNRFCAKFGSTDGTKWFGEEKTWEQGLEAFIEVQASQLAAKDEEMKQKLAAKDVEIADLKKQRDEAKQLAQTLRGENTPLDAADDDGKDKRKTNLKGVDRMAAYHKAQREAAGENGKGN